MLANFHKHNNKNPPDSSIKKGKKENSFMLLFKSATQSIPPSISQASPVNWRLMDKINRNNIMRH